MMMLPAVACAAGHGCSVVCVICMFTVLFLSTHVMYVMAGCVLAGGKKHKFTIENIIWKEPMMHKS